MPIKLIIGGVDVSTRVNNVLHEDAGNERSTLSFDCEPGFLPAVLADVLYYDEVGVLLNQPRFGGLIFTRRLVELAPGSADAVLKCDCADTNYYLDRVRIDGGELTGPISLKAAVTWVIGFLAPYGFTLSPLQADGPTHVVKGFKWERATATSIFNDLTVWSEGWVRQTSPTKVIQFVEPNLAVPTAPFTVEANDGNASRIEWSETLERYASKIELRWGGTGTRETSQSWTVNAGIISDGYVETYVPGSTTHLATATIDTGSGPVSATVGAAGSGAQLIWDPALSRLTAGTYVPDIGDVIVLTFTGQFPGVTVVDGGLNPPIWLLVDKNDIVDAETALAYATGLLARHYQIPREFEIDTDREGLAPGQVLTIDRADRDSSGMSAAIISVTNEPIAPGFEEYRAKAISGVYQGSPLDFWRGRGAGAGGGGTGAPIVTYTPGAPATVVGAALTKADDTNVTLALGGTPATALLQATSLTLGWTGTLAAARLNANVVQGITNDTNVTGSIAAQVLTLGWSGTLAAARGGTGQSSYAVGDLLYASGAAALSKLAAVTAGRYLRSAGATTAPVWSTLSLPNAATANRVVYATGADAWGEHAGLTFNGTTLTANALAVTNAATVGTTLGVTGAASFSDHIGHPSFVSRTTRWRIDADGAADFRFLYADELHVKAFIADLEQALAGGQIITKSVTLVGAAYTLPALGGASTLTVRDLPSAENMPCFVSGDTVALRIFDRKLGGLIVGNAIGVVTAYADLANGLQSWTFTRNSGVNGGTAPAGAIVPVDAIALDFGVSGSGYYEVSAIDGTETVTSITRSGSTATVTTSRPHGFLTGDSVLISGADITETVPEIVSSSGTILQTAITGNTTLMGVVAGNTLVLLLSQQSGTIRTFSVSDDKGNTWNTAVVNDDEYPQYIFYANNVAAGDTLITVTASGTVGNVYWKALQLGGVNNAAPLNDFDEFTDAGVTDNHFSAPVGQIDTTAPAIIFAVGRTQAGVSGQTPGSGFTNLNSGQDHIMWQYRVASGAVDNERGAWDTNGSDRIANSAIAAFRNEPAASDYNGVYTITVTGPTTFTYTPSGTPPSPATGVILLNGINGTNAPYAQIVTWVTSPIPANLTLRTRFGNLRGITGQNGEYGLLAGTYAATNGQYFRASNSAFELHGIDLKMWDGSTEVIRLSRTAPSFALGNPLPSAYGTGAGIWMGKDSGAYKFRVGDPSGGRLAWDGTTLTAAGWTITADRLSASNITLISGAANTACLAVGNGSTDAGINSASAGGDIAFWAGTAHGSRASAPFRVTAAGAIAATSGAIGGWTLAATTLTGGNTTLDSVNGVSVLMAGTPDSFSSVASLKFTSAVGGSAGISGSTTSQLKEVLIQSENTVTGDSGRIRLKALGKTDAGAVRSSTVLVTAGYLDGVDVIGDRVDIVTQYFRVNTSAGNLELNGQVFAATDVNADYAAVVSATHNANPIGVLVDYPNAAPNIAGRPFFRGEDSSALRFEVYSNGGIAHFSANNVNLCDARSKHLAGPARSSRSAFRRLAFWEGRYTDSKRETDDLMVTAQDVQAIWPDLVEPFGDTGMMGVREQGLWMRGLQVLHELDAEVVQLRQELNALKQAVQR